MGKKDDAFGRMAIGLKLLTEEQLVECQAHLEQLRQQGTTTTIARVMVQRGVLTTEQAKSIVGEMKKPRLSHIGQFRLIERIGQGGMGTVYKARQESLDKTVAVKVLSPALARRGDYVQRFLREARSCGQLSHPNIVVGIAVGEADGYYYFAMEYVDGPTVKDVMRREGKIGERRALEITLAIARALEHAHEQRLVHRDIKPGNILLTTDGTPKLADLGLAKEVETDQSITQAAIPIGTPYYISPEQVRGQQDVDQRADLYAMGATLYHMVTGVVPFEGATAAVVMTHHLNDPIPDAREHAPDVSGSLVSIIRHAMAKDRDARYQSATELREDVEAALAGTSLPHAGTASAQAPEARSERLTQRRARAAAKKRRTLLVAGAVGGAIVLALALFLVLRPKGTAPQARTAPQPAPVTPPQPKAKRPRPKAPTKPPPAQKPKVDPESVLRELVEWAATAADRATVEKRFSSFVIAHAGTATAGKAKSHLAELKAQWAARDRVRTTVEGLIEKGEFAAALRTLGKPPVKLPDPQNAALIGELKDKVASAIESHVKQRTQEAEEAVRNGDLAGARTIYEALVSLGLPKVAEASRQAMARLAKTEGDRVQRRARRAFAEALHACEPLIKAGKLAEAGRLFAATEAKGDERLAALLKDGAADVERVAKLFAAIEAEVNALAAKGGRARIRGIKRPVAKAAGGVIACKLGGRTSEFGIHDLTLRDLEEFQSFKAAPLGAIAYQLYRGDISEAKAELDTLAATSKDACVARWLEQIEWRKAIG
ncbi:serine/threonine protein kinase, partial [bacterium]|nr:serine/threonine protein kinase [bacterium]